jgi:hypothetical protein
VATPRRSFVALILVVLVVLLVPGRAQAHGVRTAYIELTEIATGNASIHLRLGVADPALTLVTASPCALDSVGDGGAPFDRVFSLRCPGSIVGAVLEVRGLGAIVDSAVIWVAFVDGRTTSRLLDAATPSITLPARTTWVGVARQYVKLGVVHILTGYDHLLFLLLLVLTLRDVRAVLVAESAFTVSHSISFCASTLGWIRVPSSTAEACIAVSLLLLALDVGRKTDARPSAKRGAGIAFVFGLVHGLGFAGGLREIGLPDHAVPAALASFAVGVEIGQVAFLALVLLAVRVAMRWRGFRRLELSAGYGAGGLSAYWLIERLVVLRG